MKKSTKATSKKPMAPKPGHMTGMAKTNAAPPKKGGKRMRGGDSFNAWNWAE